MTDFFMLPKREGHVEPITIKSYFQFRTKCNRVETVRWAFCVIKSLISCPSTHP